MGSVDFLNDSEDVVFIRDFLKKTYGGAPEDNDISYVVDLIYEYYEKIGMFEDNENADILIEEDELVDFVAGCLKEDGIHSLAEDDVRKVVEGEFEYCKHIGIFE